MRDIEFRGKRTDNGEWVYGYVTEATICRASGGRIETVVYRKPKEPYDDGCWVVDPETVGQYTGLADKNGTKIFEGDIVTMPRYGGGRHKSAVYFKGGKFAVDGSNYGFKDICPKNMQVIGNIYDNKLEDFNNGTC